MFLRRVCKVLAVGLTVLGAAAVMAPGCIPDGDHHPAANTFRATHVGPAPLTIYKASSTASVWISFNRGVDLNTLTAVGAMRFDLRDLNTGQFHANVPCKFMHTNDNKGITAITFPTVGAMLNTAQQGHKVRCEITIHGALVRDQAGHQLDGKGNGHPGSDFHGSCEIT